MDDSVRNESAQLARNGESLGFLRHGEGNGPDGCLPSLSPCLGVPLRTRYPVRVKRFPKSGGAETGDMSETERCTDLGPPPLSGRYPQYETPPVQTHLGTWGGVCL